MPPDSCSICHDPKKREWVNRLLAQGIAYVEIMRRTHTPGFKDQGFKRGIDRLTISKHAKTCLTSAVTATITPTARKDYAMRAANIVSSAPKSKKRKDVPELVHDMVLAQLEAGDLRVTVKDGLEAAKIKDRRVEKQKDRDTGMAIAELLAQMHPPAHVLPKNVTPQIIEGEAVEV